MIGDRRPLSLSVPATGGTMDSGQAVSVGLIVTELVINALKHAFPGDRRGEILVSYDVDGNCWRLSVSNDGVGRRDNVQERVHAGLGTSTIDSLAHQLKARVDVVSGLQGMSVMLTHVA
jgi:two-component sensor histidine kinase